jgi:uracil DNA glycosylase
MELTYGLTRPTLSPGQSATVDLLLTFHADYVSARRPGRRPLSLSIVLDRSGSMSGAPLKQATTAAGLLVRQLSPADSLSVVVYDNRIETLVAPTLVADPEAILKKIHAVRPGGATALHGGWDRGCDLAASLVGDHVVRRVLLLTDGQANVGVTATPELVAQAAARAAAGVVTSTLGFGLDFNEDLLIGMAEAGRGNFYFIETPDDATQVFLIEGESITAIAAQDLVVTLRPRRGVTITEALDARHLAPASDGSLRVPVGDVYGGEDRHLALTVAVNAPDAEGPFELFDVEYRYDPVAAEARRGEAVGRAVVRAEVRAGADERPDPTVMRAVSRLRVALAKERAVRRADAREHAAGAEELRREAADQRARGMDEEYEIAEEVSQLEHFAAVMAGGGLDRSARKILRDQSYQGRARSRADLSARGSGGGSAKSLPEAAEAGTGVLLTCEREGGKLRVKAHGERVDGAVPVLVPRAVREEGARYVADEVELSAHGTFYRVKGSLRRLAKAASTPGLSSGLQLDELFEGGGEAWLPLLKPVIESRPDAADFIGPRRDPSVVPVRELTFQALKPNPPEKWKVVVFGQNPYPRVESATGIAMFDNTFNHWKDSQFGRVTSIRCIIKAAVMSKHGIPKATPIADIRALLDKQKAVQPPEWFQAMLTQGVLLLNAALTASADGGRGDTDAIARHTAFWRPVVEKVVEEILKAKQASADPSHKGVVFAWWGVSAKALKAVVQRMEKKYPAVKVRHIDHPNPAAQGDIFCDGDHFGAVNAALKGLGMETIDWLPGVGWNKPAAADAPTGEADRMGDFIARTMDLHKLYLERLQEVKEEPQAALPEVTGVRALAAVAFADAVAPLTAQIKGLGHFAQQASDFARRKLSAGALALDEHEVAALYLYTCDSGFYRQVNAALRDPDRAKIDPFRAYLRLLLAALEKIERFEGTLWRGVAADLRGHYPAGRTVTWWGVSSCTAKLSVAHSFLGAKGKRTLFSVRPARAVGVRAFSAFSGEEEYLLAPGTALQVVAVKAERSGLCTIELEEVAAERAVR